MLKKWFNPVQWGFYLVQRCINSIQWCKRSATVKIRQLIITKDYTPVIITFVTNLEMALIRWVDAQKRTITEGMQSLTASGFPMMGFPSSARAGVAISFGQSFPTVGTKSLLPVPSLLYSVAGKSRHNTTSNKNGWSGSWEGDIWVKIVNGKPMNKLAIRKNVPIRGWDRRTKVWYYVSYGSKQVGRASSLAQAKKIGDAFFKGLKRA